MKLRKFNGYIYKFANLSIFIGAISMLAMLFKQYTTLNPSTREDILLPIGDIDYLIPSIVCNLVAAILFCIYWFRVSKEYRPYKVQIKDGRVTILVISILVGFAAIAMSIVMTGYTYKTLNLNRNEVAIGLLVVLFLFVATGIGLEQYGVYKIELDILRAKEKNEDKKDETKSDDGDKPQASSTQKKSSK